MRNLTEKQEQFVVAFTSKPGAIGNASAAARHAGYSEDSAAELGRQLLDKPHVREAIDKANRDQLSGSASTKAIAFLERVIDDEEAPIKVRVDAAKAVLDRGGFSANRAEPLGSTGLSGKDITRMTAEELTAYIAEGQSIIAAYRRPLIDITPDAGKVVEAFATDAPGRE